MAFPDQRPLELRSTVTEIFRVAGTPPVGAKVTRKPKRSFAPLASLRRVLALNGMRSVSEPAPIARAFVVRTELPPVTVTVPGPGTATGRTM